MTTRLHVTVLCILGVASLTLPTAAWASNPPQYKLTDLGVLSGYTSSAAYGINNSGQVVGTCFVSGGQHAFLYSAGTMQAIAGSTSYATAINANGQIVGGAVDIPFLYSGGTTHSLGSSMSSATAINNQGVVVGLYETFAPPWGGSTQDAVLFNGVFTEDLGSGSALGINDGGQIAGFSSFGGYQHACVWNGSALKDLGTLSGGTSSQATAINAVGQVAGYSDIDSIDNHAFLYSGNAMQDLGTLGGLSSQATAINVSGQVVGYSVTSSHKQHAFLFSQSAMLDLNNLVNPAVGWTLTSASGINDKGQIVGSGKNSLGKSDAFLLTPLMPGDFNEDGVVNDADYTTWADYFGKATPGSYQFGSDASGGYNDADYTTWADNFGQTAGAVPEPASLSLLAVGVALLRVRKGSRS